MIYMMCVLELSFNKLNDHGNHKKAANIIYLSIFWDVNHLYNPCQKILNSLRIFMSTDNFIKKHTDNN